MNLIFRIQKSSRKGPVPVDVILEKKGPHAGEAGKIYREKVESADKVLEGLDKILKKSRIGITAIKSIKVDDLNKNRYTSYRIVKIVEKALKIKLF